MRVEVIESRAEKDPAREAFSDAALERALKSFTAAVGSDDSLFNVESSGVAVANDTGKAQKICRGSLALRFREETHAVSRRLHFSLVEKLSELLKAAGSAESLGATLCLVPEPHKASKSPEFVL